MRTKLISLIFTAMLLLTACSKISTSQTSVSPSHEADLAREALLTYFDSLHTGNYQAAAKLYGGSYRALQSLFPEIAPSNYAILFKTACEGSDHAFYCWKLKDIVEEEQISLDHYLFKVRFEDDNGKLLTGGDNKTPVPCLPTETCPRSLYDYTVVKVEDEFLVQELPVCASCWP